MAKTLKLKVPKRVGGVKIPKYIRKGPLGTFLNSSGGQVVVAECLMLAAGALAASMSDPTSTAGESLRHPVRGVRRAAARGGVRARELVNERSSKLANAFGEAAQAFRNAMQTDTAEDESPEAVLNSRREEEVDVSSSEDDSAKKKRSKSGPDVASTPH